MIHRISLTSILASILVIFAPGCAQISHLNDPARSKESLDTANLLAPRDIPYETQERNGMAVSYNLLFVPRGNFSGYRLTLIFRNTTKENRVAWPRITLQDADGLIVEPSSYEAVMTHAATLAGTPVTPYIVGNQNMNYYHTGTIRNAMTGSTYQYSGRTTSTPAAGFASGFASGMAQGAAISAAQDREEGRLMLRWGSAFYLRSQYQLPPNSAVSGALLFPASSLGVLPLKLTVDTGVDQFVFTTTSSPP